MKKVKLLLAAGIASAAFSMTSFAGEWKQDANGWWYQNDDGSYSTNTWQEIGGKQYYFDANGYMLHDTTTPDGKQVGSDGSFVAAPLFDFDIEDSRITYTGWKTELDYNGDLCVVLYYNFTNKQSEPQGAYIADYGITVYQNGVECDTTWLSYDNKDNSLDNYSKKITQGTTLPVGKAYKIKDMSALTIQIKELWNWSNPKSQTVTLNIH